ncbi:hypothetical protein HUU61_22715 [Rhodopseudomonas palustris]|uniref:Uncharacterized protein n=1 Tax=Rhodopseudomonas palustris (strain BisB5) TaxID=316057 RepID=Q12ZY1_RHOPS|nr:hypothetical protein RPD_4392 [Rhodopseudomonas palustris BisB5]MBB1094089.1 hypothetical protein [Rhodopseudomonas palustris]
MLEPERATALSGPALMGCDAMAGWLSIMKKDRSKNEDHGKTKPPPVLLPVDDLYDSGDIAAPERDRDDEQRDL